MTTILIIIGIAFLLSEFGKGAKAKRIKREQERIREEQARIKEEQRRQKEWAKAETARRIAIEREQMAQRKEQERQAKEQERQAKELARHEEMLLRTDNRLAVIEGEIAHNREIVDRIAKLIKLEEAEQSKCTKDSPEWAKHEKKIVSLMNQQYNAQKKITKAKGDRRVCEQKISA